MKAFVNDLKDNDKEKKNMVEYLYDMIKLKLKVNSFNSITILCIGTDRSTGDSLGPLVGSYLKYKVSNNINVIGNLHDPAHAKNLYEKIGEIPKDSLVIAIDACLGSIVNIGQIVIKEGTLSPGAALNKDLPKIGHISITGTVNMSGAFEFMVLQNTRLSMVIDMSEQITDIIKKSLRYVKFKSINVA